MALALVVKVEQGKPRKTHGRVPCVYKHKINGEDYKCLAQVLADLEIQGLPIQKAITHYLKELEKNFPW